MMDFVLSSVVLVRPMSAMRDAPALAKAMAVAAPMPEPPPVMRTVLPWAESSGLAGSMAGYEAVCQVFVRDGKGGDMMVMEDLD